MVCWEGHRPSHDAGQPRTATVALSGPEIPMAECWLVGERCFPKWMADFSSIAPDHCCHDRASLASAAFSSARDEIALRFVNPRNATGLSLTVELPGVGGLILCLRGSGRRRRGPREEVGGVG